MKRLFAALLLCAGAAAAQPVSSNPGNVVGPVGGVTPGQAALFADQFGHKLKQAGTNTPTPTFTPTSTAVNTSTPTATPTVTLTATPTATTVLPLSAGGTSSGLTGDCAAGQVLVRTGGAISCQNVPIPNINVSGSLYVDQVFGSDGASCGPLNLPCQTITGTNGAFAKINAKNGGNGDNCFPTCSNDSTLGCGRCVGSPTTGCNEHSDCTASSSLCSAYTCSSSGAPCSFTCTSSPSTKCTRNGDCPSGDCGFAGTSTCSGGNTCLTTNASNACSAGGSCSGPTKVYGVHLDTGTYNETLEPECAGGANSGQFCRNDTDCPSSTCSVNGNTAIPSPGCIRIYGPVTGTYLSIGATIQATNSTATVGVNHRSTVAMFGLQVNQFGAGDALALAGDDFAVEFVSGVLFWGTGHGFHDYGGFGSGGDFKGNFTNGVAFSDFFSSVGNAAALIELDSATADTYLNGNFIQTGRTINGDAAVQYNITHGGSTFNMLLQQNILAIPVGTALGIHSTDGTTGSVVLAQGNTLNGLSDAAANTAPTQALDIEAGTLAWLGPLTYNACLRIIASPGTVSYADTSGNTWGGGVADLGNINCANPRSAAIPAPALVVGNLTEGAASSGTLSASTSYCYSVTSVNGLGESLPSTMRCKTTANANTSIIVAIPQVPGATSYNLYGRTSGSQLKIANVVPTPPIYAPYGTTSYTDTGSVTPSGAVPGSDTTFQANNEENGEHWYDIPDARFHYAGTTRRVNYPWSIQGPATTPSGQNNFIIPVIINLPAGSSASVAGVNAVIESGTSVTFSVERCASGGTCTPAGGGWSALTGFSGLVASTPGSVNSTFPTAVATADKDQIAIVITAVSGNVQNIAGDVYVDYAD